MAVIVVTGSAGLIGSESVHFFAKLGFEIVGIDNLARYHLVISYYDCFEKVLSSEIYYYCSLVDYAFDVSKHETYALL